MIKWPNGVMLSRGPCSFKASVWRVLRKNSESPKLLDRNMQTHENTERIELSKIILSSEEWGIDKLTVVQRPMLTVMFILQGVPSRNEVVR